MSSRRSFYFATLSLATTWSSSVLYLNAAALDVAYPPDLKGAIAQRFSSGYGSGYGYGQNSGSQDLLPPSLGGGSKVQPIVTPPSASPEPQQGYGRGNGGNGGYGNSGGYGNNGGYGSSGGYGNNGGGYGRNNMNSGYGGRHHHRHHGGGYGYSPNMRGGDQGGSYGRWNNSSSLNSSQSSGGPVIKDWNTANPSANGTISVPKLGATRSDSHIKNYEITDTASGAEVPLIATPKTLH